MTLELKVKRYMGYWLLACLGMIFVILVLGGITRLTGSGLSITDIQIFKGMIPPWGSSEWQSLFEAYQKTPEFEVTYKNEGMSLAQFQSIFWLEYLHRLLARFLAGFVFLLPFIYFVFRYYHQIPKRVLFQLLWIFSLGALQGFLGWFMVQSGLDPGKAYIEGVRVRVSPYRLVVHLGLAFLIYAAVLRVFLNLWYGSWVWRENQKENQKKKEGKAFFFKEGKAFFFKEVKALFLKEVKALFSKKGKSFFFKEGKAFFFKKGKALFSKEGISFLALGMTLCIFLTILSGGLVAGVDAGLVYQSFPLMHGYWIPPDVLALDSFWDNVFQNKTSIQFQHRVLALSSFLLVLWFFVYASRLGFYGRIRKLKIGLLCLVVLQISLGVITLLSFVPKDPWTVVFGSLHQATALFLWTLSLWINYELA